MTSDLALTKAVRRREIREAFPHPLNQIALRHVDAVAALGEAQRSILSRAILRTDVRYASTFIEILHKGVVLVQNEQDLVALVPSLPPREAGKPIGRAGTGEGEAAEAEALADLLQQCYPDMPRTSAEALARAEVMETCLGVVRATRSALRSARSDFVVVTLFALFEEQLRELKALIDANPAFLKAIQRSRPHWGQGQKNQS